ncbi:MAG: methyltransferase domain-containing protein [Candidatus Brocadiae bacterium]|nr:methyltransferase domain-containing protein [Candidatus Brocadiia bacterium]
MPVSGVEPKAKRAPRGLLRRILRRIRLALRPLWYFGFAVTCPICNGRFRKFLPYERPRRPNIRSPRCSCLDRHRLLWLYLRDRTSFFADRLKVLHVGPRPYLQRRFRQLENLDYLSVDISSPMAMVKMDITNIALPDSQFDCIICHHVLEHVPDDERAMTELYRVLRPGGWAILQSFIDPDRDRTFEDPSVVSAEERTRLFGQGDHVRVYGRDYKERLEGAGFTAKADDFVTTLGDEAVRRHGLPKDELVYFCTKQLP